MLFILKFAHLTIKRISPSEAEAKTEPPPNKQNKAKKKPKKNATL